MTRNGRDATRYRDKLSRIFSPISRDLASDLPRSRGLQVARGQALVLFMLLLVVMLALAGFAIDGLRAGIVASQAQRAAEAAALAGAIYLPDYPDTTATAPDGYNAVTRALVEAARNGFTQPADVTVVAQVGPPVILRVTIHYQVALTLTSAISPAPIANEVTAAALALAPIDLFAGTDPPIMSDPASGLRPVLVGPAGDKGLGDPYSVLCAGPLACSPGNPGNPDHVPTNYNGLGTRMPFSAVPAGASYRITIPPDVATGEHYSVWVRGATAADDLHTLAFSLYRVPQLYARAADLPLAAIWPFGPPPNTFPAPPLLASQIIAAAALPSPNTTWVRLPATVAGSGSVAATYRLTVEAIAGAASVAYTVRICQDDATPPNCAPTPAALSAWNFATLSLTAAGTYPLATLPATYAGRTIALRLFAPALGGMTVAILAPGATIPQTQFTIPPAPGNQWLSIPVTLPPDYAGGTWQISLLSPVGIQPPYPIFTLAADLVGSPVTLIPID